MASRGTISDAGARAIARPSSSMAVNLAQASGVACCREICARLPQPPLEITAAMRGFVPAHTATAPPKLEPITPMRSDRPPGAGQKIERVAEILDLFETDDPAELASALAAAAHVEAERDIAEFVQHRVGWRTPSKSLLVPKPCSTRKAERFSPGRKSAGTPSAPWSRRPADGMLTIISSMSGTVSQIRADCKPASLQLATNRMAVSLRSSIAAAVLPKNKVSPGRRVTPSTIKS